MIFALNHCHTSLLLRHFFMFKHESLARNLFSMTWPMLLGVIAIMSFQLVDSFFISLLGTDPMAAMGFTMPITQLMIGMQVGIGIAATALISRALGAEKTAKAKRLSGLVLLVGTITMAFISVLVLLLKQPILAAMKADSSLFLYTDSYWLPWLISSWAYSILYFGISLFRAYGDTKLPGLLMVGTSLLNMALDPLFIFVFDFGLPGAAYATIVACLVGGALLFTRLHNRQWVRFDISITDTLSALRNLAAISLPAMLSQLMPGIAALLATRIVAGFGSAAVAAWALGTRLETFSIVVVLAFTMSVPPMLAHMLGAKRLTQIDELVTLATKFILIFQTVVAGVWLILQPWLVSTLTQDPETATYLANYMLWVPISYSAIGVCILMVSVCNALGLPMRAVVISVLRLFAFYLPAVAIGAYFAHMDGVYYGVLVGNAAAGLCGWWLYRRGLQRLATQIQPSTVL